MGMQFQDFVMVAADQTNARLYIYTCCLKQLRYNSLVLAVCLYFENAMGKIITCDDSPIPTWFVWVAEPYLILQSS